MKMTKTHRLFKTSLCLAGLVGISGFTASATAQAVRLVPATRTVPATRATPAVKTTKNAEVSGKKSAKKVASTDKATHKHDRSYRPKFEGKGIKLHTFCLDNSGNLLACVEHPVKEKGDKKKQPKKRASMLSGLFGGSKVATAGALQVYDADFKLIKHIPLPFVPTAINLNASGHIFIGGNGKVQKMDASGKVLASCEAPSVIGLDKKAVKESLEEQQREMQKMQEQALENYRKQIKKIEDIAEDKRTKRQKRMLKSYTMALKQMEKFAPKKKEIKVTDRQVAMMVRQKGTVRSIAVDGDNVFVVCPARKGYSYTAWRMDSDLKNAKRAIKRLNGCCGQLDLQCHDGKVIVAENTKFRVTTFSLEGKKLSSFGKAARTDGEGFGSCCNPMNVRCTDNGDVITAESSIGTIKRFSPSGELVAYIGRARIGAGCKHVAVDFDSSRNRYYIQYEDNNEICVMDPVSKVGKTAREVEAEKAAAGLGKTLVGKWHFNDESWKEFSKNAGQFEKMMYENRRTFEFSAENKFILHKNKPAKGSKKKASENELGLDEEMFDEMFSNQTWSPRKQSENRLTIEIEDKDGVITNTYVIEFANEDTAVLEMTSYGQPKPSKLKLERIKK